ncbi:MAG: hypothetical protein DRJ03_08000 [Chloroflexi bacterium]|nr:MAG: hypothetical protein DRJ03_08000 [Chloroflexota bacterium]
MCGVIGIYIIDAKRVVEDIKNIMKSQISRGKEGFGASVLMVDGGMLHVRERWETLGEIWGSSFWEIPSDGDFLLFHNRLPTSTPNIAECNHPIANEDESIMMVHNGHVWVSSHEENAIFKNHQFETLLTTKRFIGDRLIDETYEYTDSEYAVHQLEDLISGGKTILEAVEYVGDQHTACAFLYTLTKTKGIYFASNMQDLTYQEMKSGNRVISSVGGKESLMNSYGVLIENDITIHELDTYGYYGGWNMGYDDKDYSTDYYYDGKQWRKTKKGEQKKLTSDTKKLSDKEIKVIKKRKGKEWWRGDHYFDGKNVWVVR